MSADAPVFFEELPCESGRVIGLARLNAPRSLNALSLPMIRLLHERLTAWAADERVACVWLEGAGEKAFCAGGDIVEMYKSMTPVGERNGFIEDYFASEYRLDHLIHVYEKPLICWAHGIVMGGGMGLMQGAAQRVVTEKTKLAMPEITIGLYPDVGGSFFLNRAPGKTGLFAGLTGVHLNAGDALFMGMADVFIHAEQRDAVMSALQGLALSGDAATDHVLVHRLLREASPRDTPASPVREHFDVIQRACDAATLVEVGGALHHSKTHSEWMQRAVATYERGCAQTAWLVWEQLRRARHLSLAEVFRMEWVMSVQCAMHADFREGVRALLIEKDGAPQFRYHKPEDVPAAYLDGFFVSPAPSHPLADL